MLDVFSPDSIDVTCFAFFEAVDGSLNLIFFVNSGISFLSSSSVISSFFVCSRFNSVRVDALLHQVVLSADSLL